MRLASRPLITGSLGIAGCHSDVYEFNIRRGRAGSFRFVLLRFKPGFDRLANVRQGFCPRSALRSTATERGDVRDETGIFTLLDNDFQFHEMLLWPDYSSRWRLKPYFTYPFCLKWSIASCVERKTLVAVSVMNGDGMPLQAQTT